MKILGFGSSQMKFGAILLTSGLLAACGGGDSGTAAPTPTLTGTVAIGAAASGATVAIRCAAGAYSATSGANVAVEKPHSGLAPHVRG
jgi:hypothetical protein